MPENYVLLERTELNASAASVTFANIPQTGYTDLKLVISARDTISASACDTRIRFNSDSGSNYTHRQLLGNGASASSNSATNTSLYTAIIPAATSTASTFGNYELYIPNYTASTQKSVSSDNVSENNGTTAYAKLVAGLWTGTAAINSITFLTDGTAFTANSTFSLYGVAALGTTPAIAPKADGGNIVATDGTYWYHAFTSSGNFVPQVGLTADVMVIAGGGGASNRGNRGAGGGGAGGFLVYTSQTLTPQTFTCTIGGGGAAGVSQNQAVSGSSSQFASLTASAGGGRGAQDTGAGQTGGSGGGGYIGESGYGVSPSGQGNAGGAGSANEPGIYVAGGGGGAGAAGNAGIKNDSASGKGGTGTSSYSSWGSATSTGQNVSGTYYYAGGGGGGSGNYNGGDGYNTTGGSGGGGGGSGLAAGSATAGTANTGGGGGGANGITSGGGGAGGSGIIIIRYTIA